jgi:hypothetical protein
VHSWLARYEAGGLEGLADRSHRPEGCPHQMDPVVEARVLELRRVHRSWGARRIRFELGKAGVAPVPSESGIYRALVRAGLIEPGARRRRKEQWRRWERRAAMERHRCDFLCYRRSQCVYDPGSSLRKPLNKRKARSRPWWNAILAVAERSG